MTIRRLLKRNNIKIRTSSEAGILAKGLNLPEQEIINSYIKEKLNCEQIGKIYKCSGETILCLLKRNNVKIRSDSEACFLRNGLNLPEQEIIDLYINRKFGIIKIADIYKCSDSPIYNTLIRNNIEIRSPKEASNIIVNLICIKSVVINLKVNYQHYIVLIVIILDIVINTTKIVKNITEKNIIENVSSVVNPKKKMGKNYQRIM